jgi:hypothetical protein
MFVIEFAFVKLFAPLAAGPYLYFIGSCKFLPIHCLAFQYALLVSTPETCGAYVEITNQVS